MAGSSKTDNDRYSEEFDDFGDTSADGADYDLFEQYLAEEDDLSLPERGDLREGMIVEVRSSEILINIGAKRDGVVPQADIARLDKEYAATLVVGEMVPVVVSKLTTDEGMLILSIADALQKRDWLTAEKMLESGEITVRQVVGYNKGGLLVEYGHLRGFIPASHVVGLPRNLSEDERNQRFDEMIGDELPVEVIEVERRRRRLVLSHRFAERKYREERKAQLFEEMKVGDVVEGEVRSLRPFGAFVDIGGADGLLHVSEIGWTPVSHPRDVLQVGDVIKVEVMRLDADRSRIGLSRKKLLPNPWESIEERYGQGETVLVTITRVVDFGAFAQLEPGVEGLIHVSELAEIEIAEPLKSIASGDRVAVKILRVDPERQRIGLSRRQADDIVGQALLEAEIGEMDEQSEAKADLGEAVAEEASAAEEAPVAEEASAAEETPVAEETSVSATEAVPADEGKDVAFLADNDKE
ncbi:MAG: S1 RNA-binding domain-containing protein [Caldilineaceae bacterium]|nr:S1 RNA-binding domain-containing protein [Caldilineaceae bacterium]